MATFQVNEYDVNVNTKKLTDATAGGGNLNDTDKPRLYFNESVVWGLNCLSRTLSQESFTTSDTFELWADIDFDHTLYEGTLNAALTTAAATTAIVIDYATAPTANTIPSSGGLLLRDDDGNRERVAYTAVTGAATTQATYTVNKTLTYPYATGDFAANEDPLMVASDNDVFNVSGDWASLDVANGKISVQLDMTRWKFSEKVQTYLDANPNATEVPIWVQINRYVSGNDSPSVLLQDLIYAKPSVRDIEEAANVTGPSWALADARYLKKFSLYSSATEAVANDDLLIFFNTSVSAENKKTVADFRHDILNAQTVTAYTLVLTDDGKTVSMTNASANTLFVPSSTGVAFEVGSVVAITREGAGVTTIKSATTGVTINGTADAEGTIDTQYDGVALVKRGTDTWVAIGNYTEVTT